MPDEAPLNHDPPDINIDPPDIDPYPAWPRMSDEAPLNHDPPDIDIDIDIDPYPASRRMPDEAPLYHDLSDIDIDVDPYPASRRMSDEAPLYHDPPDIDIDIDPYPASRRMPDEAPPTTTSGLYYNEKYGFYALSRFDRRTGSVHGLADLQLSLKARCWRSSRAGWESHRSDDLRGSVCPLAPAETRPEVAETITARPCHAR